MPSPTSAWVGSAQAVFLKDIGQRDTCRRIMREFYGDDLPATMVDFEHRPEDDELSMLACRRTTFEWVLRRAALAEGRVEFRTGVAVNGLVAEQTSTVPRVTGVRLTDGTTSASDLVVVAAGRRSTLPDWLQPRRQPTTRESSTSAASIVYSRTPSIHREPARSAVISAT